MKAGIRIRTRIISNSLMPSPMPMLRSKVDMLPLMIIQWHPAHMGRMQIRVLLRLRLKALRIWGMRIILPSVLT